MEAEENIRSSDENAEPSYPADDRHSADRDDGHDDPDFDINSLTDIDEYFEEEQEQNGRTGRTCAICNKFVFHLQNYRRHIRNNHGEEKHKCAYCSSRFYIHNDLRKHIATEHPPTVACVEANCTFKTDAQRKLKQHLKRAHTGDVVLCSIAGCGFSARYRCLQKHMKEFHGNSRSSSEVSNEPMTEVLNPLECGSCSKSFPTRIQLKRHVARVHDKRYKEKARGKLFKCSVEGCDRRYRTPGALDDHMNTHTDEKPFECQRCDRAFHGRAGLAVHLRRYHLVSIKDVDKAIHFLRSESEEVMG